MVLKKTLIVGAASMVLGGVMVIGGLSAGAETNIAWDKGPKIVNVSTTHKTFKDAQVQNLRLMPAITSLKSCVAQSGVLRRPVHQTRC